MKVEEDRKETEREEKEVSKDRKTTEEGWKEKKQS